MVRVYRYRLYPNKEQQEFFAKTFGCVRFIHNKILEDKIAYYKETGKMLNVYPAQYKEEYPFLKEVDSRALSVAERNLNQAFQNFFKRPDIGFPRFKSKHEHRHAYTTRGAVRIEGDCLRLPKVGNVRIVLHRECKGEISSATIVQECSGRYYVSLLVHCDEMKKLAEVDRAADIRLDTEELSIVVNGKTLATPEYMQESEKRIKTLQKQLSRCRKGSKNWEKRRKKLAKQHEHVANQRKHYLNVTTKRLVRNNQRIVVDDVSVRSLMKNSENARTLADLSWFEFNRQLEYKADWYGREYVKRE